MAVEKELVDIVKILLTRADIDVNGEKVFFKK